MKNIKINEIPDSYNVIIGAFLVEDTNSGKVIIQNKNATLHKVVFSLTYSLI